MIGSPSEKPFLDRAFEAFSTEIAAHPPTPETSVNSRVRELRAIWERIEKEVFFSGPPAPLSQRELFFSLVSSAINIKSLFYSAMDIFDFMDSWNRKSDLSPQSLKSRMNQYEILQKDAQTLYIQLQKSPSFSLTAEERALEERLNNTSSTAQNSLNREQWKKELFQKRAAILELEADFYLDLLTLLQSILPSKDALSKADQDSLSQDIKTLYQKAIVDLSKLSEENFLNDSQIQQIWQHDPLKWTQDLKTWHHLTSSLLQATCSLPTNKTETRLVVGEHIKTIPNFDKLLYLRNNLGKMKQQAVIFRIQLLDKFSKFSQEEILKDQTLGKERISSSEEERFTRIEKLKSNSYQELEVLSAERKQDKKTALQNSTDRKTFYNFSPHTARGTTVIPPILSNAPLGMHSADDLLLATPPYLKNTLPSSSSLLSHLLEKTQEISGIDFHRIFDYFFEKVQESLEPDFHQALDYLNAALHQIKISIEEENKKSAPVSQKNSAITKKEDSAINRVTTRIEKREKTIKTIELEKKASLIYLAQYKICLERLLHLLGLIQRTKKDLQKKIDVLEKKNALESTLIQECDLFLESEGNSDTTVDKWEEIIETRIKELPEGPKAFEFIRERKIDSLEKKENRIEEFNKLKNQAEENIQRNRLEMAVIRTQMTHIQKDIDRLEAKYAKYIREYQRHYNEQPNKTFSESVKSFFIKMVADLLPKGWVETEFPHPDELIVQKYYADMGYNKFKAVSEFLKTLSVDPKKGETWISALAKEVQAFKEWAQKHPKSAAEMAANIAQLGSILISQSKNENIIGSNLSEFLSSIKANVVTQVILEGYGQSTFEPLEEEQVIRFRALADLLSVAPHYMKASIALWNAMNADTWKNSGLELLKGLFGVISSEGIKTTIRSFSADFKQDVLIVFRRIVNILASSPYIDSVIEQRNMQYLKFLRDAKETMLHPKSMYQVLKRKLVNWYRAMKIAWKSKDPSEKWIRGLAQIGVPLLGVGGLGSTLFLMSSEGAFFASIIFGGTVGYTSFLGITGFVFYSIHYYTLVLGEWISKKYPHTQDEVHRIEIQEYWKKNRHLIEAGIDVHLKDLHAKGALPRYHIPQGDRHAMTDLAEYFTISEEIVSHFKTLFEKEYTMNIELWKRPLTILNCIDIFTQKDNPHSKTTLDLIREEVANKILPRYPDVSQESLSSRSHEGVRKAIDHMTYDVMNRLEKEWLKEKLINSSVEYCVECYVRTFKSPVELPPFRTPSGRMVSGTFGTPEEILMNQPPLPDIEELVKQDPELTKLAKEDGWLATLQSITEKLRSTFSNPSP